MRKKADLGVLSVQPGTREELQASFAQMQAQADHLGSQGFGFGVKSGHRWAASVNQRHVAGVPLVCEPCEAYWATEDRSWID